MQRLRIILLWLALLPVALGLAVQTQAQVKVTLYNNYGDTGSSINLSGIAQAFTSQQIRFGVDYGYYWFPLGGRGFGTRCTGFITVPVTGDYVFGLSSDDGSYMFLNGTLIVANGYDHGPSERSSNAQHLIAGTSYPFEIQFYENGGGQSSLDLYVTPPGGSHQLVPASYFSQNQTLALGVGDQRTWVGNTSEFTVNIKNTGIVPRPLTAVAINGTPWVTLLSTIPAAPLQPGEQTQLTYRLTVPNNATGGGPNSPVIIPVSLDVLSGTTKFSEPFQIQLYQTPATQIVAHVQDDATNQPIASALVALDNTANLYQTDAGGNVVLTVTPGARTVFAYAPNHLPDQQTVILDNGALAPVTLRLKQGQALAVSSVVATPLTLAQIQSRGINLNDPSNFFIYDFVVKLRIGDATVPSVIIPAHPEPGSTIVGSFGGGSGGGGGAGGYYSFYFPTGDPTVRVETWIVIEGDIRVLKQFWDATVFINNNTNLTINNVDATLAVPTGLSLPPLFGQPQPLTKTIGTIPAMTTRQAEWTVRGDVAGTYQLTGTATGTLALGGSGVPLASTLRSNTITVVAPRLSVAFQTPSDVVAGQNFNLGIDITNESSIDLQLVEVHIKTDRLINCVLAPGQSDLVSLGSIAIGETKHVNFTFTSLVTGKVLEVQTYVSPNPEISPDVTVNAAKVKGVDDFASTHANNQVNIPVLTNDVGDTTLSVSAVTQGAHGAVTTDGLQAFYIPNPGFIGVDYFSYVAQDTQGNTGTANVMVTVSSVSPTISSLNPVSTLVGTAGFDLIVNGSGFDLTTQATWNGATRTVTFVSPSQIKVTLLTSDLAAAGLGALMVRNPSAGSALTSYAVYNPSRGLPVLTATVGAPTRSGGNILVPISIANTGQSDARGVTLSAATLRTGAGLLTVTSASSLGGSNTIFIGTSQQFTLVFPVSAGAAGTAAVLQFSFAPSGGSAQTRSQRMALP